MKTDSQWQPIETEPKDVGPVLFFMGRAEHWKDMEPGREERFFLGWWDGRCFRDSGTGHETFEQYTRGDTYLPTHWMRLPEPPK
jgi:hypothetical protein